MRFPQLEFTVMASAAHFKQSLLREQNSLFMRAPAFMKAAFEGGRDKEAATHFYFFFPVHLLNLVRE